MDLDADLIELSAWPRLEGTPLELAEPPRTTLRLWQELQRIPLELREYTSAEERAEHVVDQAARSLARELEGSRSPRRESFSMDFAARLPIGGMTTWRILRLRCACDADGRYAVAIGLPAEFPPPVGLARARVHDRSAAAGPLK